MRKQFLIHKWHTVIFAFAICMNAQNGSAKDTASPQSLLSPCLQDCASADTRCNKECNHTNPAPQGKELNLAYYCSDACGHYARLCVQQCKTKYGTIGEPLTTSVFRWTCPNTNSNTTNTVCSNEAQSILPSCGFKKHQSMSTTSYCELAGKDGKIWSCEAKSSACYLSTDTKCKPGDESVGNEKIVSYFRNSFLKSSAKTLCLSRDVPETKANGNTNSAGSAIHK